LGFDSSLIPEKEARKIQRELVDMWDEVEQGDQTKFDFIQEIKNSITLSKLVW
jgi:hypothetical protein